MPDTRPGPATAASKAFNRLRARGPGEVATLAWERARGWVSSRDTLVMFVRDAEPTKTSIPGLTFRAATAADARRYARDIGTDSARSFTDRLSARTRCFVVDDGDVLLHASWVTTAGAWTREIKQYIVPPVGDAYIYESFTRAEARGRGIYPFVLQSIVAWGADNDVVRVWVAVEQHNAASMRSVAKAGFAEAFRLPFTRRFGRVEIAPSRGPEVADFLSRTPPT